MINGFHKQTHDLTDYELKVLLPVFVRGLEKKVGASAAITNKQMVSALKKQGYKVSDARVRKIVNHIRNHGLINGLIATSEGYYVSRDPVELMKYADSLSQRKNEIGRVETSMRNYIRTLLNKAS